MVFLTSGSNNTVTPKQLRVHSVKTMYVWHDVALLYSYPFFERFGYILLKHHEFHCLPV